MGNFTESAIEMLNAIREKKPLIHHITNYVTVNDCANMTLAIGASPIMADDIGEVREITAIASALVINIGTLNQRTVESMVAAGQQANEAGIPVLLDPVGAGASSLRNKTVAQLLKEVRFDIIRGNISEIKYIAGLDAAARGVDADASDTADGAGEAAAIAKGQAEKLGCIIAITGKTDVISDGKRVVFIDNGHEKMGQVSGTGCMCNSLAASFAAVAEDALYGAAAGVLCMGIAGELAWEKAWDVGLGSFHMGIIDATGNLNPDIIRERVQAHEQ